jgi:hypothetical protein
MTTRDEGRVYCQRQLMYYSKVKVANYLVLRAADEWFRRKVLGVVEEL